MFARLHCYENICVSVNALHLVYQQYCLSSVVGSIVSLVRRRAVLSLVVRRRQYCLSSSAVLSLVVRRRQYCVSSVVVSIVSRRPSSAVLCLNYV